jgi:carotenoid cleavage dioxygenase-like enzyme
MLSSVYLSWKSSDTGVEALYSNKYVRTDMFIAEAHTAEAQRPILLSMATLLNPDVTLWTVITRVLKTIWAVLCSFWSAPKFPIKRISVANTNIVCHQGRVLATCESGPPMRVLLPGLQTVGWFNGCHSEGESFESHDHSLGPKFGGTGLLSFFQEWTTGHVSGYK